MQAPNRDFMEGYAAGVAEAERGRYEFIDNQRRALALYHKAMFLGDWFIVSPASERRAIRQVFIYAPYMIPRGCNGHDELIGEHERAIQNFGEWGQ